ncbi:MAG: fumarylacetoacetase [Collimonas fungivorans]|uniref:fumarylacetoacetase n=1 Tax=Collimonas fungivorans TaxID=158899 RepID=UPI0026ECAA7F|nr:fumarylacetoacetase [Collimonas fungivorans]MDB5769456.1 fumarylacetoacetase [Collimonas fungivorans]
MKNTDETHDPARKSWVETANHSASDFPIQNLPLGIFSYNGTTAPRFGIAIGDCILDVAAAADIGLLTGLAAEAADAARDGTLNRLFALGRAPLRELRKQVAMLLDRDGPARDRIESLRSQILPEMSACRMHLPTAVGNYTDFYAGIHHAIAAGSLLTPENPLPANYKWVPIAYHGRASSVRASGNAVRRPMGQRPPLAAGGSPSYGPCERLDFELEMGFYVGPGNAQGEPISITDASKHIVGFSLLNDWSARDIQRWEMFPLGPFLAKNFATTVSPWVVTADALEPFRVPAMARPDSDPQPLNYLLDETDQRQGGIDVSLSVQICTGEMLAQGSAPVEILESNAMHLYWTSAQMLTHHASGGCNLVPGDLIGTGTISGPKPSQLSSMLELTFGGTKPVALPNGEQRAFLQDGDEITFSGKCHREGFVSIGFGTCSGRITR